MDPNEALRRARAALARIDESITPTEGDIGDLANAFEALDGWLTGGGFLPDAWKAPHAPYRRRPTE